MYNIINLKMVILLLAREYSFELAPRSRQHNLSAKLLEFHLSPARPQISSFILLNLWKDQVPDYFVNEVLFSTRNAPHAYINFVFFFSDSVNFFKKIKKIDPDPDPGPGPESAFYRHLYHYIRNCL